MPGERSVVPDEVDDADYDPQLTTVRAISVLALFFSALALATIPFGLMRFHEGSITGHGHVSLYGNIQSSISPDGLWLFYGTLLWMGLSGILFIASIGCLRLFWWGRSLILFWAVSALALSIGRAFIYFQWLLPPWRDDAAQARGVIDSLATFGTWAGSFLLSVTMLIYFNRSHVRSYFAQKQGNARPHV
jgi:hypothetical protein